MSLLSTPCPSCHTVVEVPLDAVLLATTYSGSPDARMAFICPRCDALADERVSRAGVAILVSGGCVPILTATAESS